MQSAPPLSPATQWASQPRRPPGAPRALAAATLLQWLSVSCACAASGGCTRCHSSVLQASGWKTQKTMYKCKRSPHLLGLRQGTARISRPGKVNPCGPAALYVRKDRQPMSGGTAARRPYRSLFPPLLVALLSMSAVTGRDSKRNATLVAFGWGTRQQSDGGRCGRWQGTASQGGVGVATKYTTSSAGHQQVKGGNQWPTSRTIRLQLCL